VNNFLIQNTSSQPLIDDELLRFGSGVLLRKGRSEILERGSSFAASVKIACVFGLEQIPFPGVHRRNSGRSTQKESHVIQKSMEQSGHIYSNHCIETYEEIKESFHYLTHQTGDPDMVRV
jgi:hypothetical protein